MRYVYKLFHMILVNEQVEQAATTTNCPRREVLCCWRVAHVHLRLIQMVYLLYWYMYRKIYCGNEKFCAAHPMKKP